jgi:hypothetical protein
VTKKRAKSIWKFQLRQSSGPPENAVLAYQSNRELNFLPLTKPVARLFKKHGPKFYAECVIVGTDVRIDYVLSPEEWPNW